jgi:hypothetical protein
MEPLRPHSSVIQVSVVTMITVMRSTRFTFCKCQLALATAIFCIAVTQPAFCQDTPEPRYSLDEAVMLVKKSVGGEVLRAKERLKNGRTVYEIRVLTDDGLVRDLLFDAESGLEE